MSADTRVDSVPSAHSDHASPSRRGAATAARDKRIPEMATQQMANALPALPDDDLIGVMQDHVVPRDGEPDLKFKGRLLASAAPEFDNQGRWHELRVFQTQGGKFVLLKVGRSILAGERDTFKARVHDPDSPGVLAHPMPEVKYREAVTQFFGFTDLAKQLYTKLHLGTEEIID